MAIDLKKAKKMCSKFTSMAMMPTDKDAIQLRAETLAKYARSESHALRVVTGIVEREAYFPTVALIVTECEQTPDDAQLVALRKDCAYCHGEGWRTVDGPYGTSAAYPCNHTAQGNPRMGVPIPAAVESHYKRESIEAEKREADWKVNPKNSMNQPAPVRRAKAKDPLRRVSAKDFEGLVSDGAGLLGVQSLALGPRKAEISGTGPVPGNMPAQGTGTDRVVAAFAGTVGSEWETGPQRAGRLRVIPGILRDSADASCAQERRSVRERSESLAQVRRLADAGGETN